jgi:hypothetical protein
MTFNLTRSGAHTYLIAKLIAACCQEEHGCLLELTVHGICVP